MKQIFWGILIVVAVIFGVAWYVNRAKMHAVNSGEVFVPEQAGEKAKGDGAAVGTAPASESQQGMASGAPEGLAQGGTQRDVVAPPAADSIQRNPPNGMIFAGTGKYQLYRQGDITWRLNTDTGQACVLFATDAEWSKAKVYQHGCGGS